MKVKVVTANVRNFPDMTPKQQKEDVTSVKSLGPNLVLWQEIAKGSDWNAIKSLFPDSRYETTPRTLTGNVTTWDKQFANRIGKITTHRIGDNIPNSHTPPQYITRVVLDVEGFPYIEVHNLHYIAGAFNDRGKKDPRRPQRWSENWKNHRELVLAANKLNRIVIFGGDWNRRGTDIPKFHPDQKWIAAGGRGIDHIAILLPSGYSVTASGQIDKKVNSDHHIKGSTVEINKKEVVVKRRIDGIDISHYQTNINWSELKDNVKFIYAKATEGATYIDKVYDTHRNNANKHKIPFGAYHFARPNKDGKDAVQEANYFLQKAKPASGDLPPMLDLEDRNGLTDAELTKWVGEWIAVVEKHCGVKPLIYTPYSLRNTFGCMLWVARYNNKNEAPKVPSPWKRWDIWQFSNGVYGDPKRVKGYSGNCDLNELRAGLSVSGLGKVDTGSKPKPPSPSKPNVSISRLIKAAKTDPPAKQGHKTYEAGTKVVEAALVKEKLMSSKYAGDGSFGSTTVTAYAKWQKKLGYRGKDADGIPGRKSLSELGKKHGFNVVN